MLNPARPLKQGSGYSGQVVAKSRENGMMLGREFIKEKAKEIAKELNIIDHKCSDG